MSDVLDQIDDRISGATPERRLKIIDCDITVAAFA